MHVTHLRHFTATTGHYHHGDEVKSMVWDNLIWYVCEIWVKYSVKGLLERHKQRSDNGTLKCNNHTFLKKYTLVTLMENVGFFSLKTHRS